MKIKIVKKLRQVGSHRGGIIRVSREVPKGKDRKEVITHEKIEHYLMKPKKEGGRGMKEAQAHKISDAMTKNIYYRNNEKGWNKHQKLIKKIHKKGG